MSTQEDSLYALFHDFAHDLADGQNHIELSNKYAKLGAKLINQARQEGAIEELEKLKHFDSFNEPYTWQGDERPGKLVDIRIKALKESK